MSVVLVLSARTMLSEQHERGSTMAAHSIVADANARTDRMHRLAMFLIGTITFVLLSVFSTCCTPRHTEHTRSSTVRSIGEEHAMAVTIVAACVGDDGSVMFGPIGSGVVVAPTEILTADHVVLAGDTHHMKCSLSATDAWGSVHPLYVQQQDEKLDVARMGTLVPFAPYYPISLAEPPPPGARVCSAVPFPYAVRRCGDVQFFRNTDEGADLSWTSVVEHGNSGSGLYDEAGHLIGIVVQLVPCEGGICGGRATTIARVPWILGDHPFVQ